MNSLNNPARPFTIPANTNYDNNYSRILKTSNIITQTLTDGVATLTGGYLTGVQLPINEQDAVPKSYITGSNPGGSSKDIQYNNNGIFDGNSNLQYLGNNSVGTLSLGSEITFTDGTLQMVGSYITGIQESSNSTSSISKRYIDFAKNRNYVTNINTTINQTYSALSVINGTIVRNNSGVSSSQDYLPLASSIIMLLNNQFDNSTTGSLAFVGSFYNFSLINESENNLVIFPNIGNTIICNGTVSNVVIPPYYVLNSTVYIEDFTSTKFYVNNIQWSVVYKSTDYQDNFFNNTGFQTSLSYYIKDNMIIPAPTSGYYQITNSSYVYTSDDVNKGIIFRNPTTHASDSFLNILTNSSFIIQNLSTNYNLSINTADCTGTWTITTGIHNRTSLSISTAKSAYMWLNNVSSINTLNVIGIADLNG